MLFDFLYQLEACVKVNPKLRTVYFHNLSRFDGMFILNYYAGRANLYKIKPLVRNGRIYDYEIKIYLDDQAFQISIPNRNQDTFIRRGYYGGHVDVYKPVGDNLYYYDVNSLYPYIMQTYPMPSGTPEWKSDLKEVELDDLFGFIEAYVVCPTSIEHPFLPRKAFSRHSFSK